MNYRMLKQGETILPGDEWQTEGERWVARDTTNLPETLNLYDAGGHHAIHRRKVEYPEHTPPAPPEGMRWEYDGMDDDKKRDRSKGKYYYVNGGSLARHSDYHFVAVPDVNVEKMDEIADTASQVLGYVRNDPKGAAGALKPQLQLIPTVAMREEAKALDDGRNKYGENNWRSNNVCVSTYIGAILRHTLAYRDGEDVDPESKSEVHHLGSVRACCAILLDAMKHGTLVDDRPTTNQDTTI